MVSDLQATDQLAIKATKGNLPTYSCVSFGPYTTDQSAGGRYKVSFRLKIGNISSSDLPNVVLWLGATCDYGQTWLLQKQVKGTDFTVAGEYQEFEALVNIPAGSQHAEYCVYTYDQSDVYVDQITVQNLNATTYYYHCDYLGSPRVMSDASGAVIWRQDYYAFGSSYGSEATGNTHKFTGHIQDQATGQYYAKQRYFTTGLGRFSQPEPLLRGVPGKRFLLTPQRLNPYVYCLNNPLLRVDPDGLTDINIQIDRTTETTNSTIGNFHIQGTEIRGNTLELPNRNNQTNISRIPAGTYRATQETQEQRGTVLRIQDVPGRTGVLVHRGNVPADTRGCPLPGTSAGTDRVNNSTAAMNQINQHIETVVQQDQQNNQQTNIIIQINDPQPAPTAQTSAPALPAVSALPDQWPN